MENPVLHSTFVLIKHRVVPMDLVLVQTPARHYYSFLSLTWGIVADIDYESEKYRNLGEARFTLGAIKRIVNLRAYPGKLSFLPVAEYTPKTAMMPKVLSKIRRFSLRSLSGSMESLDSRPSRASSSSVVLTGVRSASMSAFTNGGGGGGDIHVPSITEQGGSQTEEAPSSSPVAGSGSANPPVLGEGEGGGEGVGGVNANNVKPSPSPAVVSVTEISSGGSRAHNSHHQRKNTHSFTLGSDDANADSCDDDNNSSSVSTTHKNALANGSAKNKKSCCRVESYPEVVEETVSAAKQAGRAVPTPLLPPLDQPVPDHWVVVQGRFVLACALYQTHLGSDMLAAPSARLADGVIHLMFVRDGISRNHLLNLFLTFSGGVHVDSPDVELVPVLAFRLEPDLDSGNIMIDGERLRPTPVQGQVLPSVARIMAIQ
ncbi:hypothetical protein ACOMHN_050305 [Nucella lapillus]